MGYLNSMMDLPIKGQRATHVKIKIRDWRSEYVVDPLCGCMAPANYAGASTLGI